MRREKLFSPSQVPDASWGETDFAHAPLCPFYIESLLHLQNDAEQKVIRIILDTCHIQTAIRHKPAHLHAWKRPVPGEQKDKTLERICREGCMRTEPAAPLTWELQRWSKEKEHVLNHSRNPNQQISDLLKTLQVIPLQHKIYLFKLKDYKDPTIKFLL